MVTELLQAFLQILHKNTPAMTMACTSRVYGFVSSLNSTWTYYINQCLQFLIFLKIKIFVTALCVVCVQNTLYSPAE
jgi:hypothetical protein